LLSRAVARGTLPPALLLAGPAGVSKKRVALALAETINCTQPVPPAQNAEGLERDACGACPSCRRIARGVHPDVMLVEPGDSGSIKIEAVREVIREAGRRPFEARRRVVIVNEADALVEQAQHALLKTLEEPPSAAMLILISAYPDTLLPTIQSRCRRLRFSLLSEADVARVLAERAHVRQPLPGRADRPARVLRPGRVGVRACARRRRPRRAEHHRHGRARCRG